MHQSCLGRAAGLSAGWDELWSTLCQSFLGETAGAGVGIGMEGPWYAMPGPPHGVWEGQLDLEWAKSLGHARVALLGQLECLNPVPACTIIVEGEDINNRTHWCFQSWREFQQFPGWWML